MAKKKSNFISIEQSNLSHRAAESLLIFIIQQTYFEHVCILNNPVYWNFFACKFNNSDLYKFIFFCYFLKIYFAQKVSD